MSKSSIHWLAWLGAPLLPLLAGCSSMEAPAAAAIAVSKSAANNAAGAGALQYAPVELHAAREKLARADNAMAARDYEAARDLALLAQADADLARGKADSAKARATAAAVQEDIRVLREELARNAQQ